MKRIFVLFAAVAVTGLLCGPSLAADKKGPRPAGNEALAPWNTSNPYPLLGYDYALWSPAYPHLTPEKRAQFDAVSKDAAAKMQPLHEQMMAKRLEYGALARAASPDPDRISRLAGEIAALHTSLVKEYEAASERLAKEVGVRAASPAHAGGLMPIPFSPTPQPLPCQR